MDFSEIFSIVGAEKRGLCKVKGFEHDFPKGAASKSNKCFSPVLVNAKARYPSGAKILNRYMLGVYFKLISY